MCGEADCESHNRRDTFFRQHPDQRIQNAVWDDFPELRSTCGRLTKAGDAKVTDFITTKICLNRIKKGGFTAAL